MGYFIVAIIFFYIGAKLGVKYQDFQDIMLARRIAKMITQKQAVEKNQKEYNEYQDEDDGKYINTKKIERIKLKRRRDLLIEDGELIDN